MRHDAHYVEELSQHQPATVGRMIPIDKIDPNPGQPRSEFGDLTELTESIAEKGVLEPLLVKPSRSTGRWMIIAGERRYRAARAAGLIELPCVEMEVDEGTVAEIALIENMQRKDLTVWEEADGLLALCERFGYTREDAREVRRQEMGPRVTAEARPYTFKYVSPNKDFNLEIRFRRSKVERGEVAQALRSAAKNIDSDNHQPE